MLVTLSGIVMLVSLLQEEKALLPMLVTDFPSIAAGILSSPDALELHLVMVIASSLML